MVKLVSLHTKISDKTERSRDGPHDGRLVKEEVKLFLGAAYFSKGEGRIQFYFFAHFRRGDKETDSD